MRILLITQWFDPEPTFKGLQFAQELRRQGHEVQVLTGFPNYPGGKVYPGYNVRLFQRETMDGIPVLRVALYPSHDQSGVKRAANYLSFAVAAAVGSLFLKRPDVAYVYHPPATVSLPAMVLKALRGVPFVYDIQDLWPDTLAATGMMERSAVLTAVDGWMNRVYRSAAQIAVLSNGFKQKLIERGVPEHKLTIIPNWTDETQVQVSAPNPVRMRELGFENRFNVVFAGTMGKAQALETVLQAAELLTLSTPQVRFIMIGGGVEVERLKALALKWQLPNVVFLPRRSPSEIGEILGMADILLVHLKDDPLFAITIPSKTQAYLMAGKPILMGVRGDASRMVEQAGAGYSFEPEHPEALARAVERMMQISAEERIQMGLAGQTFYHRYLSLHSGTKRFLEVFEVAVKSNRSSYPLKRVFDLIGSGSALLAFSPVIGVLAVLIILRLGRPVFFTQIRPGLNGRPFMMYKFRTMTDDRGEDGQLLSDDVRLTAFGNYMRATSLDELPGLLNVFLGHMSLVGPRPLLLRYTAFFTDEEARRLHARPGITGWAQINGRNTVSWDERLALDVWYMDNQSFILDLKILWLTILKVYRRQDVVVNPESLMQNLDEERHARGIN